MQTPKTHTECANLTYELRKSYPAAKGYEWYEFWDKSCDKVCKDCGTSLHYAWPQISKLTDWHCSACALKNNIIMSDPYINSGERVVLDIPTTLEEATEALTQLRDTCPIQDASFAWWRGGDNDKLFCNLCNKEIPANTPRVAIPLTERYCTACATKKGIILFDPFVKSAPDPAPVPIDPTTISGTKKCTCPQHVHNLECQCPMCIGCKCGATTPYKATW